MRLTFLIFSFFLVFTSCGPNMDQQAVAKTFSDYKTAILKSDGKASVNLVTQSTIDLYQQCVDLAQKGSKEEIQKLPIIDRLQILQMRHRIPAADWEGMDGKSAFVYAVDKGWIGEESTRVNIGAVTIEGAKATAKVKVGEQEGPIGFVFLKENGAWKLDLTDTLKVTNKIFQEQISKTGLEENAFLLQIISQVSGSEVNETIWEPLKK